jgi:hypothetical protein
MVLSHSVECEIAAEAKRPEENQSHQQDGYGKDPAQHWEIHFGSVVSPVAI